MGRCFAGEMSAEWFVSIV